MLARRQLAEAHEEKEAKAASQNQQRCQIACLEGGQVQMLSDSSATTRCWLWTTLVAPLPFVLLG